ncbi:MAG: hypothetical protein ACFFBU_04850 [Promethearchaeota archaeon]
MDRSPLAVFSGIIIMIVFIILTGLTIIPLEIAIWLPLTGFIICSLVIGIGGRYRVLHLLLISFLIYLGFMIFLAVNASLLPGVDFGPLSMDQIQAAWTGFQGFVNMYIPFLGALSGIAETLRTIAGEESLIAIFLEFAVASAFVGFIGLLVTGISGFLTRSPPLYAVTAPEAEVAAPEPAYAPAPVPPAESAIPAVPTSAPPAPPQTVMEAPPPMPVPRAVEEAPPPPLPSKGGSPSAQAISGLKGKVKKHLKGTGQKAPAGQSRCPHCNATVIRGSRFCNSCEKPI